MSDTKQLDTRPPLPADLADAVNKQTAFATERENYVRGIEGRPVMSDAERQAARARTVATYDPAGRYSDRPPQAAARRSMGM